MKAKVLIGYSTCHHTRDALLDQGCDAYTCDLRGSEVPTDRHLQCDIWGAIEKLGPWDFAILHPTCTYLTVSAAWAFTDGPYHQRVSPGTLVGEARRKARDDALDNFQRLLDLPFPVAIENPGTSFINKAIRPPDQIVHPWMFGDDASKRTGLWLTRGVPHLVPHPVSEQAAPRLVCKTCKQTVTDCGSCYLCGTIMNVHKRWGNQTNSGQNNITPGEGRWLQRSKVFDKMGVAMGTQWGKWIQENIG